MQSKENMKRLPMVPNLNLKQFDKHKTMSVCLGWLLPNSLKVGFIKLTPSVPYPTVTCPKQAT